MIESDKAVSKWKPSLVVYVVLGIVVIDLLNNDSQWSLQKSNNLAF